MGGVGGVEIWRERRRWRVSGRRDVCWTDTPGQSLSPSADEGSKGL